MRGETLDAVKFAPCECAAEDEDWQLIASGEQCPDGVSAKYRCRSCDSEHQLEQAPKRTY